MRDFSGEQAEGASLRMDLRDREFSWSLSRHRLFRKCRRAYWIRYYLTQGGWDQYASPEAAQARECSRLLPADVWKGIFAEQVLNSACRSTLHRPASSRLLFFRNALVSAFSQGLRDVFSENCRRPRPASPLAPDEFCQEVRDEMQPFFGKLLKDPLSGLILSSLLPDPQLPEKDRSFVFEGITVWLDPGVVWKERNTFCSLRIYFTEPDHASLEENADLWDLAVRTRNPEGTSLWIGLIRDPESGFRQEVVEGSAERAEKQIRFSAFDMREKVRDESVSLPDFEMTDDPSRCPFCLFRKVCRILEERFG